MPKRSNHPARADTAVIGNRPGGPSPSPVNTSLADSSRAGQGTSGRLCYTVGKVRPGRRGVPLDALYAVAFLGSGDLHAAQQAVIDATSGLCGPSGNTPTCPRRRWRFLADHVHLANESSRGLSGPGPTLFSDAGLSILQHEAVAVRVDTMSQRRGARLVGVPVSTFGRQALAGVLAPDPACGQPPRASLCCECPGMQP